MTAASGSKYEISLVDFEDGGQRNVSTLIGGFLKAAEKSHGIYPP